MMRDHQHTGFTQRFLNGFNIRRNKRRFSDKIFYDVDVNDARAITKVWITTLVKRINETATDPVSETIVFSNLDAITRALRTGKVDLLILLPMEHLEISKQTPLQPILTGIVREAFSYEYALLVHCETGAKSLGQLRGRKLVVDTGGKGRIPQMWLDTVLLENGLPESEGLFKQVKDVSKTSQAVLPVFFGKADACLVPLQTFRTMVELNPQLGEALTPLAKSPGFCRGLVCARQDIYDRYKGFIQEALHMLNLDPQGQQLLTIFRVDELISFEPSHLAGVRKLAQEYELLKAGSGSKP